MLSCCIHDMFIVTGSHPLCSLICIITGQVLVCCVCMVMLALYPLLAIPTLQPDRITQFVTKSMPTHTYYWLCLVSCGESTVVKYSCNDYNSTYTLYGRKDTFLLCVAWARSYKQASVATLIPQLQLSYRVQHREHFLSHSLQPC